MFLFPIVFHFIVGCFADFRAAFGSGGSFLFTGVDVVDKGVFDAEFVFAGGCFFGCLFWGGFLFYGFLLCGLLLCDFLFCCHNVLITCLKNRTRDVEDMLVSLGKWLNKRFLRNV